MRVMRAVARSLALAGLLASMAAGAAGLTPRTLGILINRNDPQSVVIGEYYRKRRGVPTKNVVRLDLPSPGTDLTVDAFRRVKALIDQRTPGRVQAFAVTWVAPYRVGCMALNTAIASGFDPAFCATGCARTRPSAYYDADSAAPFTDLGVRPTMSLAAGSVPQAKALIDRGIASDGTAPRGTAYLLSTSDAQRNVRAGRYGLARAMFGSALDVQVVNADSVRGRQDVMFYFTGITRVPDLQTNRFLPGALADHLTSAGGDLLGVQQMSILDWIAAGATGSFGTVVEPCNFVEKFPDVPVLLRHYLAGETLIEAYWKSVLMPGQGIFVGEPLARPYPRR